jgi:hypothetical protein
MGAFFFYVLTQKLLTFIRFEDVRDKFSGKKPNPTVEKKDFQSALKILNLKTNKNSKCHRHGAKHYTNNQYWYNV